ncbi:hypothetical protein D2T31_08035 [Sinirhodobacter populi]|uniref:EF-hand domain-containing protein n=1 Tax=Paenirhodobacter populi TaxID=2306993 RepID=A0A443KC69_9RHOB|nr:hypothetical protein [Sinirhodobacter populi]RWR30360.1 hypothetical protein D2T31_08035 [Sinirhodobacter populi]
MTGRGIVLAALLLAAPAGAHRLDEYLQAATIAVAPDGVELHLRLTPGAEVAGTVIAGIDRDGDGALSRAEWAEYATQVQRDLSLAADGQPLPLHLTAVRFAEVDAVKAGEAVIELDFTADLPPANGPRILTFENRHRDGIAVYMVNALIPRDPSVRILGQHRSPDQSSWRLDFTTEAPGN